MKNIVVAFLLFSITGFAQKSINNYKYVIVPNQFNFFKTPDKYQTSSLTKFLFNKHGFKAFLSNEQLPDDLSNNRCLALKVNVKNNSGMFTTKNIIELQDCNDKVVFVSQEGRSREKQYKESYHEAIRNAFKSIEKLNYSYTPLEKEKVLEKSVPVVVTTTKVIKEEMVNTTVSKDSEKVLYAQEIKNGFQLVNTKPEVVFQILKTSIKDVFVIKDKNGILYKEGSSWIAEFDLEGVRKKELYKIKF